MIRCQKCKNQLADDARYCNICGASQNTSSPAAQSSQSPQPKRTIQPVVRRVPIPANREIDASIIAKPTTPLPDDDKTIDLKQRKATESGSARPATTSSSGDGAAKAPGIIRPIVSSSSLRQNTPTTPLPPVSPGSPIPPISPVPPGNSRPPETPTATMPAPEMGTRPPGNPTPVPPPWTQSQQSQPSKPSQPSQPSWVSPPASNGNGTSYAGQRSNGNGAVYSSYTNVQASTLSPYEPAQDTSYSRNGGEYHEVLRQDIPLFSPESLAYTSQAAEHWRKSWRDRQYAEAGPAENVSKGQASVPAPLLTMQHSFVRMRAVVQKQTQDKRKMTFGFWMTIFIMVCLILGMGAYIVYSYLPGITGSNASSAQVAKLTPTLSIVGTGSTTFTRGQVVHVHGEHFGANNTISFMLDTTTPILNSNGSPLTVQASSQGAFDVTIPITASWPIGNRIIQAVDARTNTSSYLDIQVTVAGKPEKSSPNLNIALNGQPIKTLAFTKQVGQPDPPAQRITITNTSSAPLQWAASAQADHNLQWLSIDDNNYQGQLDISQPYSIGISVDTTGLSVTPKGKPYTGQILFTLNGKELLTLPVQLTIIDTTPEMVYSPQPIYATGNADGTCKAGATLTLINLGSSVIHWTANPDQQGIIQFTNNQGVVTESGVLQPSGQDGDTYVLNVRCSGVQSGHQYHISIYANSQQSSDTIYIQ